jgi:predicted ATPase/DNA-binding CsgD family transcriptional regulator
VAATATQQQRSSLPVHLDSFVGRRRELGEVRRLLERARLLTLTGPGGAGKTRLATRAAGELSRSFPGGAHFVELGDLRDPALVPAAVATALGLRDLSTRWLPVMLADYLADARLLLVLDDCEHLVDACAALVLSLLRAAPGLRVLATSRQPLGIEGEVVLPLPPLGTPPAAPLPAEGLLQYDSVRLFMERSAAVQPGFALDEGSGRAVAELCRRLEGIPLAIELAAVRMRALSAEQMVDRLDDRFRLLNAGSKTASPKHQTLQATIDWSYDLLPVAERTLWARLSVFAEGFELEAAEAVCAWAHPKRKGLEREEVFELLASLVEKSIALREVGSRRPRYRLLDTIREYGRRRLRESGEEDEMKARHLAWYATLGEQAEPAWWGPDQAEWFDRLEADHANLQAVIEHCLEDPSELEQGLVLATRLWLYWHARGRIGEGRRWISLLLRGELPDQARSRGLSVAGYLALVQDDLPAAWALLEESLALALSAGSMPAVGVAVGLKGWAHVQRGELDEAAHLLDQAIGIHAGEAVEPMSEGLGVHLRALVALLQGDDARAAKLYERALTFCRGRGERWLQAGALVGLAMVLLRRRQTAEAIDRARESLRLARGLDDRWGTALAIEVLACATVMAGQPERGALLLGGADAVWASMPASVPHLWKPSREKQAAAAREWLGEQRFGRALASGAALSPDHVVRMALEQAERGVIREVRPRTPTATTEEDGPRLTAREQEIAALVAAGHSNKEIAARLFISVRTAETHVENIMSKLGFVSRTQIAAWAAGRSSSSEQPAS